MQTVLIKPRLPSLRAFLASSRLLRAIGLPLLRQFDVPITMTNPYSRQRFRLLSFTHKGYWFYRKQREAATMKRFNKLIRPGDTVFEVGGHIGFLTQFFAQKVGKSGQVHVFEPGLQNQQFLRENIRGLDNTMHIDAAVSNRAGKAAFYEENMGGFMNSLRSDYAQSRAVAAAQRRPLEVAVRDVYTQTLDEYGAQHGLHAAILKIDVEGAELAVLQGAPKTLRAARAVMIEVSQEKEAVFVLLRDAGFELSDDRGKPIQRPRDMQGNVFGTRRG